MALLAFVRPIDVAIFGTLGSLWILGALFIVALYRWIFRFEREQETGGPTPQPQPSASAPSEASPEQHRNSRGGRIPQVAVARVAQPLR